jgi:hypothetical protein
MTRLSFVAAIGTLVVLTTGLSAAENSKVAALRAEIKSLRAQEKNMIKAIEAHYDSIIRRDRLSEKELEELRHQIHKQEDAMLAVATTEEQKAAIHARFDEIRHFLSRDIHLDAAQINKLKEMRHAHVEHVKHVVNAKVRILEEEIKVLEHEGKPKKK